MNPMIARFYAEQRSETIQDYPAPPSLNTAQELAIAYDREYIATHARQFHNNPDLVAYDRNPLPNEWMELMPAESFVRVFVINEWTTVRVLHALSGERVGEPIIDSHPKLTPTESHAKLTPSEHP